MDKLKPILAQKFWILSAVCLLLPLTGWWLATGAMALEYTTRTKAIDDAFKGIPQPGPNQKWTDRVLALNTEEEQKVKQTGEYLWTQQLALMVWPEVVKEGVEKAGFRGEVDAKTRGEYRYAYEQELVDLHQIVSPFDATTGEGMIDFPIELIPTLSWGTSPIPPSSVQMWDSQEDIWLYRTLLQGVANINEQFGCDSIVNSKIKQILLVELRGGTPGGAAAAAEAAGAAGGMAGAEGGAMPGGAGAMPGAMPGGPGMGGGMSSLMGGGQSGGPDTLKASFDPAEQFGSDEIAAAGAEGGAGGADPMAGAPAGPGGAGMPGGPDMKGMGMPGGGSTVKKRYIEETPRFKTRGFYMELVLDHRILPEFIAELSDSKWPLRVIRVQQVDLDLSEIGSTAVGVGGPGAGAMGGGSRGAGSMPGAMPGAMRSASPARSPGMMAGAGVGRSVGPRPAGPMRAGGVEGGGVESTLDLQSAMTDPHLVNVALSGIITLYLPPEAAAAQPGAEGAPAATPAAGDPTAATAPPAAGAAAPGAAPVAAGATDPAAANPAAPAGAPAADTNPATEAKPAEETKPAADAKPAETAKPEAAKPETPPAAPASTTTPAPATPPPAKPETPAAAGAKPEPGK